MNFRNDIFTLTPSPKRTFNLFGAKVPGAKGVYFRAKQNEIIDQYAAARIFLKETETDDWEHWFTKLEDAKYNDVFKLIFSAYFYESALTYYNIVVDLSWTICYISAEYVFNLKQTPILLSGVKPIEEAYDLLRQAENNVTNPTSEDNPFQYLKKMCPEYTTAIDLIIDFWKEFSNTEIRKKYNFFKHKGKPAYDEIENFRDSSMIGLYVEQNGQRTEMVSDTQDVKYKISLSDSIEELYKFDEEKLFPYLRSLFEELERLVDPSPMVF